MRATGQDRAGHTRRNLNGHAAFRSFVPTPLGEVRVAYTDAVICGLADAEFAFGRLSEAFSRLEGEKRPDVAGSLRHNEAEASWRLAAGRLSMCGGPLLLNRPHAQADLDEIADLENALSYAIDPFDGLPISRRLLTNAHYLMTRGPRYEKKYPGEFRRSPNWIGAPDSTLATASFVPPAEEDMETAFAQLEAYIHGQRIAPAPLRAALAHYQFEVIHPFIDGNGRIGRMLTQLMLVEESRLPADILLLSEELLERADEYYARIEAVETSGDYEGWAAFFLSALKGAAERSLSLIHHIGVEGQETRWATSVR